MTRAALRQYLDGLRTSYWFLPVIGVLVAAALLRLMIQIDALIPNSAFHGSRFVLSAPADQLRALMAEVAATILATTGIVFSLLTVPLSLAASQFGSRLLRVYLRDGTIQTVLAIFVGTFIYCLLLALAIPGAADAAEPPQLAVTLGLSLTFIAFASLLILIQHIASALLAPNVVTAVSDELANVIESTFSDDGRSERPGIDAEALIARLDREGFPIYAARQGYVQAVDVEVALAVATRHDLVIRLVRSAGHFVQAGELIALVDPATSVKRLDAANIADSYRLGNLRTPSQDLEYGVNQIAEVAVRAMSAAINDPYTAMTCLDHLGARLSAIAAHPMPASTFYDSHGKLRLITDDHSFAELLHVAFDILRRASRETPEVLLAMLATIEEIGRRANLDEYRAELAHHAALIEAESDASLSIAWDKERVSRRCAEVSASLADEKALDVVHTLRQ